VIALILSGIASMFFVETKQSRTMPLVIPNIHFFWIELEPGFMHIRKGLYYIGDVGILPFAHYNYVIDVG
jgi:hypothetical protein